MFGSFRPNLWSSSNQSLHGSREPTLLCNHFYLAKTRTFLLCVDSRTLSNTRHLQPSSPKTYYDHTFTEPILVSRPNYIDTECITDFGHKGNQYRRGQA